MTTADGSVGAVTKIVDNGPDASRWNVVILGDGYRSTELATFASDADDFASTLSTTAPFDTVWAAVNVHRVDVTSTESGADDPTTCGGTGASVKTYFDATFCGDGAAARLLTVDAASAQSVATSKVPQVSLTVVIVNSTTYGGSGGAVCVYSKDPSALQIALHEMGHTAFGFADEYEYYLGCGTGETGHDNYTGAEPAEPNVTTVTDRSTIKWSSQIDAATTLPTSTNADCSQCDPQASPVAAGTVGAFAGARYFHCGIYRPEYMCRMRVLGNEFCAVCSAIITTKVGHYLPSPPTVTSFSPTSGDPAGGTIVVITGTDLTGATDVTFGANAAVTFNVDSDTQITAVSPAGMGSVNIAVTAPGGSTGTTVAQQFSYNVTALGPQVTGLAPVTGPAGGATDVVVTGTGFAGAAAVQFGATAATAFTVDSDTQITATSPAMSAGTVDVTVTTAAGTSPASPADQYTFEDLPSVTSLAPDAGPQAGGTTIGITGIGFSDASAVLFGAAPAAYSIDSDTHITATSPAGTGLCEVTVTTAAGTTATSSATQFTWQAANAPAVIAVNPTSGAPAGGDPVVVTGNAFTGATQVLFGTEAAANFTVDSDTQISAVSPAGTATVDITVTTPVGASATGSADQFTYTADAPTPTISSIDPTSGPADGGTIVTIIGAGLTGATSVTFGADAAASFSVDSDTELTATSPAGTDTVDIAVTTPAGTSSADPVDQFTFQAAATAPTVTGISPATGSAAGGDAVTISGSGFTGATGVNFDDAGADFTVDSDTQISATSPPGTGDVDVTVVGATGTSDTGPNDVFSYT